MLKNNENDLSLLDINLTWGVVEISAKPISNNLL